MFQVRAADEAAVHEEVLLSTAALGEFRFGDKALHAKEFRGFFHRHQALVMLAAEDVDNALPLVPRFQVEQLLLVVQQAEADARMRQCHALELLDHMLHLHRVALEELAPRRHVVEQAPHMQ